MRADWLEASLEVDRQNGEEPELPEPRPGKKDEDIRKRTMDVMDQALIDAKELASTREMTFEDINLIATTLYMTRMDLLTKLDSDI